MPRCLDYLCNDEAHYPTRVESRGVLQVRIVSLRTPQWKMKKPALKIASVIASSLERAEQLNNAATTLEIDAAVDELLPLWKVESEVAQTPGKIGALLPFRYVIPDQDLKLVDTAFSVFTASAAVSYFIPQIGFDPAKGGVAAITGITIAVLRMLHNLRLAVHLEKRDHVIVIALAASRPKGLSAPAILKGLQSLSR